MNVYPSRCKTKPYPHQIEGTTTLLAKPAVNLWDDVGLMKSKQVIDAIYTEFVSGRLDAVIVVAPSNVRSVWSSDDPSLGEFAQHGWDGLPLEIHEYITGQAKLPEGRAALQVVVTNYEYIRRRVGKGRTATWPNLDPLMAWASRRRVWLVLDESWAVQNPQALQTKAAWKLRQVCLRVTNLNGTPGSPDQQFAQFQILDTGILDCESQFVFRLRFCKMGGYDRRQVVGYRNMDEYQKRTAPYVLRRENVLDLPPRLPPRTIEARLSAETWKAYVAMRNDAILALEDTQASVARHAGVKHLRLAQILAGFVGGLETYDEATGEWRREDREVIRRLGDEKRKVLLEDVLAQNLNRLLVWCLFKPEMDATGAMFAEAGYTVHWLRGGQGEESRTEAKRAFAPGVAHDLDEKVVLIGMPAAGGAGLNFAASDTAYYLSNTFNLKDRDQSEGRIDRPGQVRRPRYVDVIAVGPNGQRTVDHSVIDALRKKKDVARWSAAMWRRAFNGETV